MEKNLRYIVGLSGGRMSAYKDVQVSSAFNPTGIFCPFVARGCNFATMPVCRVDRTGWFQGKKIQVIWLTSDIKTLVELNKLDDEKWSIHSKKDEEELIGGT